MRKQQLLLFGAAFFTALFVIFGTMFWRHWTDGRQSARSFADAAALVRTTDGGAHGDAAEDKTTAGESLTAYEKYLPLYESNPDFVGWLTIPGTHIDYPVVQTPAKPDYYLRRSFDGRYSLHGTPYVQENCMPDLSDNMVIYGHHMNDGTMFADLCRYADENFYREHSVIRFDTLEGYGEYEVMAVFKTAVYTGEGFAYYRFVDAADAEDFDAYIAQCRQLALYDTGVNAVYGDRLLTLSTCEYSQPNGRMVVVARKTATASVKEGDDA